MQHRAVNLGMLICAAGLLSLAHAQAPDQPVRVEFHVRYVAEGGVYVDGGRTAGLVEGMKLVIKERAGAAAAPAVPETPSSAAAPAETNDSTTPGIAAKLKVIAVAENSAVCEVESATRTITPGEIATLSEDDAEKLVAKHALSNSRAYPAVITFTEGDPLDEEAREVVPHPPLPEVNRARGRFGFEYSGTRTGGGFGSSSDQFGVVFRADITRINGTYWNLSGYWHGRLDQRSATAQPTIQDLLDRTYHLSLTYDNPGSHWVAGFGRMYLPWAASLETIDGGYFGRKLSAGATAGIFAGSTPDPTSWDYNPNRRIAGSFLALQGGDYEGVHYGSTFGLGVSALGWHIDRPFVFGENDVSYKRAFSIYHAFQVDQPHQPATMPQVSAGLSRSYLTVRLQPEKHVSFDFNHNYFRDVPTFDPQLIGTGLLDKYLFQGFSVGARADLPRHVWVYTDIGRSSSSADAKGSLNTMFGAGMSQIWRTGLRAEFRVSHFDSPFAVGNYRSLSLSRNFGERFMLEVMAGSQAFVSPFSRDNGSRFVNSHADVDLGAHYFFEGGVTLDRGAVQNYTQWYMTFGYRFDNREHRKEAAVASSN